MAKNRIIKFLGMKRVCAIIVGSVFFVAGTLKLIDPVGAGLVVTEYFKFLHLAFLNAMAKPAGVAIALLECFTGAALITGVAKRLVGWVAAAMTVFFTILTALLVIFNPHMDCGCFGEAIHLTHFQTLIKNLILLFFIFMMLAPGHGYAGDSKTSGKVSFTIASISIAFLTLYSLLSIPFIDFTPFGPGAELAACQESENGLSQEYSAVFVYEKDGSEETFTLENLPDSTWTFVRTETALLGEEKLASAATATADLAFTNAEGVYCDEDITDGQVIIVTSYKPEKLSTASFSKIASLLARSSEKGFATAFLVASDPASMESILDDDGIDQQTKMTLMSSMYFADYKTMITVNRSNGGATWIYDGEIISKFSRLTLPSKDKLDEMLGAIPIEQMLKENNRGRVWLQGYFLYTFAVMLLL